MVKDFLDSVVKYVLDKEDVLFTFILVERDVTTFEELIKGYDLNIKYYTLKELVKTHEGIDIDESTLLYKYNKFLFQSVKKMYSTLLYDDCIIMDSENKCVKEFRVKDIFDELRTNKKIYYSNVHFGIQDDVLKNSNILLKTNFNDEWYFIPSYWYFEKKITEDLISYMGGFIKILDKYKIMYANFHIFEYVLYCLYLRLIDDNGYKFISMDDLVTKYLDDKVMDYLVKNSVTSEFVCKYINKDNVDDYCKLINDEKLYINRVHWMDNDLRQHIIDNSNTYIGTYHERW